MHLDPRLRVDVIDREHGQTTGGSAEWISQLSSQSLRLVVGDRGSEASGGAEGDCWAWR